MDLDLLHLIVPVRDRFLPEGFIILGVFGSAARGEAEEESDIDILYRLEEPVFTRYPGLKFFGLFMEIKSELEKVTGKKVDLADETSLRPASRETILRELSYV